MTKATPRKSGRALRVAPAADGKEPGSKANKDGDIGEEDDEEDDEDSEDAMDDDQDGGGLEAVEKLGKGFLDLEGGRWCKEGV